MRWFASSSGEALLVWQYAGIDAGWEDCEQPYSFYREFIPRFWAAYPTELAAAPIHRLCTLARKMKVRSFVVQDAQDMPGVREELASLEETSSVKEGSFSARAVTFLRIEAGDLSRIGDLRDRDIILHAVLVRFPTADGRERSYVFEAVAALCSQDGETLLLNNQIPVARLQEVNVLGERRFVRGTYFCQQNRLTSACAHTAVRTVLMNRTGRRTTDAELNSLWGIDPLRGDLGVEEVASVFAAAGTEFVEYDFTRAGRAGGRMSPAEIWSILASLAETGAPSILAFEAGPDSDHVLPILGYTWNTDEWHPFGAAGHLMDGTRTASSSLWVDHLVVNDDELGPYFCMSRASLFDVSRAGAEIRPKYVIALLPERTTVSPLAAETLARSELDRLLWKAAGVPAEVPDWFDALGATKERRVFRTVLMDRSDYMAWLRSRPELVADEHAGQVLDEFETGLPERFWMCEVSLPNLLLANLTRLGEILVSAGGGSGAQIVAARFPGVLGVTTPNAFRGWRLAIECHVPMHSPGRNPNKW